VCSFEYLICRAAPHDAARRAVSADIAIIHRSFCAPALTSINKYTLQNFRYLSNKWQCPIGILANEAAAITKNEI
jgi:hypothetical protein